MTWLPNLRQLRLPQLELHHQLWELSEQSLLHLPLEHFLEDEQNEWQRLEDYWQTTKKVQEQEHLKLPRMQLLCWSWLEVSTSSVQLQELGNPFVLTATLSAER